MLKSIEYFSKHATHRQIHSSKINALFRYLFLFSGMGVKFLHISQCKHCISSVMQEGFNVYET